MMFWVFVLFYCHSVRSESVYSSDISIHSGQTEDKEMPFFVNTLLTQNKIEPLTSDATFLHFSPSLALSARLYPPFEEDTSSFFHIVSATSNGGGGNSEFVAYSNENENWSEGDTDTENVSNVNGEGNNEGEGEGGGEGEGNNEGDKEEDEDAVVALPSLQIHFYLDFNDKKPYYEYMHFYENELKFKGLLNVTGAVWADNLGGTDLSSVSNQVINTAYIDKIYANNITLYRNFSTLYLTSNHPYYNHTFGSLSVSEVQTAMVRFEAVSDQEYMENFYSIMGTKSANVSDKFKISVPRFLFCDYSTSHLNSDSTLYPFIKVLYANSLKIEYYPLICESLNVKDVLYTQDFDNPAPSQTPVSPQEQTNYTSFKGPLAGSGDNQFDINGITLAVDFIVPYFNETEATPFGFTSNIHSPLSTPVLREDMASEGGLLFSTWKYPYVFHNDYVEGTRRIIFYGSIVSSALKNSETELNAMVRDRSSGSTLLGSSFSGSTVSATDRLFLHRHMIYANTAQFDTLTAGAYRQISDMTLKTNIVPLRFSSELHPFNLYQYHRKNDPEKLEIGVLAQEIEKLDSRLVAHDDQGFKSIKPFSLYVVYIQKLQKMIQKQREDCERVEKNMSILRKKIKELEEKNK